MQKDIWVLLTTKWDFFGKLLLEHIEISLAAILIAIVFGGLVGILISEYKRARSRHSASSTFSIPYPRFPCLAF